MEALVCGAGIAGLSVAWWLHRIGWDVVVVERAPALADGGYLIDFWDDGYDVAEHMGLLPRLRDAAYDVGDVCYVDAHGRRVSAIDYALLSSMLDGRLLTLLRGDLQHVLHDALDGSVDLRFGLTVERVDTGGDAARVALTDGTVRRVDLLVGADGIHSQVRRLVFGGEHRFLRDLGHSAASYVFGDGDLHARLDGGFAMHTVPDRLVGCYPLRDAQVAAFFAFRSAAPEIPADPGATLREVFADMGWVTDDLLARCPPPPALYFDRIAQIEMSTWSRGRVVLVGDACHAVSLLAGQGASMAMAGGRTLAMALAGTVDVAAALAAYEQRLRPRVERKQAAGRRTAEWFVCRSWTRIRVRDAVLRLSEGRALQRTLRRVVLQEDVRWWRRPRHPSSARHPAPRRSGRP